MVLGALSRREILRTLLVALSENRMEWVSRRRFLVHSFSANLLALQSEMLTSSQLWKVYTKLFNFFNRYLRRNLSAIYLVFTHQFYNYNDTN